MRLSSLAPAYPPYDTEETNMVGKRAVKSGREIEFISARLPTLRHGRNKHGGQAGGEIWV
ncbi:MAG: hypothetical protein DRR16_15945 [Candidatus Parabeggiatoa sp. nov. 3]|nr:MAG: hypothetical protein DRR00_04815 [Gammaproteobacteria bacterium]RKZ83949.1 MAG: hypothetical protein DRR16_15945 [Gammaproteobacteria bacterium]